MSGKSQRCWSRARVYLLTSAMLAVACAGALSSARADDDDRPKQGTFIPAGGETTPSDAPGSGAAISGLTIPAGALLRADLASPVKWSRLASGTVLDAKLSMPLYDRDTAALPAGTPLRITVASSERVRTPSSLWKKTGRAIARAFSPLEKSGEPEYRVALSAAEFLTADGQWKPFSASVLRVGSIVEVRPRERESKPRDTSTREVHTLVKPGAEKKRPISVLLLRLEDSVTLQSAPLKSRLPLDASLALSGQTASSVERQNGRAYLLTALSASQSHEGEPFQALLAEPIRLGDHVFSPGTRIEGTVVRRSPPRMLSRAGKLYLRVDHVTAPNGESARVFGTLSGAEADAQTRFVLDEEGTLRGRKPGLTNALVDVGISYVIGKASDDIAETPIRAIGASMSDAAVANAARYVGLAGAATYLVTRRGRDVRLPKYSQIEVEFGRADQGTAAPAVPGEH